MKSYFENSAEKAAIDYFIANAGSDNPEQAYIVLFRLINLEISYLISGSVERACIGCRVAIPYWSPVLAF